LPETCDDCKGPRFLRHKLPAMTYGIVIPSRGLW